MVVGLGVSGIWDSVSLWWRGGLGYIDDASRIDFILSLKIMHPVDQSVSRESFMHPLGSTCVCLLAFSLMINYIYGEWCVGLFYLA
jgi:hypothetical protein